MDTENKPGTAEIVSVLLLVQAGIVLVSAIESLFGTVAFGPAALSLSVVNGLLAMGLLVLRNRFARGANWARRSLRVVQVLMIVWALFDAAFALGLADRFLEPVSIAVRLVLPAYLWRALRVDEAPEPTVEVETVETELVEVSS
jgi:hypothetical protein